MRKNKKFEVNIEGEIKNCGNWNWRDKSLKPVYTKPMAIIKIGGDEFVWRHDEIMKLIKFYWKADLESINMIKSPIIDTGKIVNIETPFLNKLKFLIENLEEGKENEIWHNTPVVPFSEDLHKEYFDTNELTIKPKEFFEFHNKGKI